MAGKNVATIESSREVGIKRREEEKTMSSLEHTETHKDPKQGNGGGRRKLKNVDGDFPRCMRRKTKTMQQTRENENSRGKGGGIHKFRHIDGDVLLSMRSKGEEYTESRRHKKQSSMR